MSRSIRLAIVGDSISAGFAPATHGWGTPLAALNGGDFGVKSVAHSGDKVAAAALIVDKDVLGRGCTWVAFLIGTNNLPDNTSAADIYAVIDVMMTLAESDGSNTLGLAIIPRGTGAAITAAREQVRRQVNTLLAARTTSNPAVRYVYVDADTPLREAQGSFTGATPTAWASSTAYVVGDERSNNGYRYMVHASGTSAASGGPTTTGDSITDGTVVWTHIPALSTAAGGATDGLHPSDAGQLLIAQTVQATVGTW